MSAHITRTALADGSEQLRDGKGCSFTYQALRPHVLLLTIAGDDEGQFGSLPLDELNRRLTPGRPLELYVDTREAGTPSPRVREAWTGWFAEHRPQLARVTILASSRFVNLTISVAKLFSRTGELIQIFSDPRLFEQALAVSAGRVVSLGATALPVSERPEAPLERPAPAARREVRPDGSVYLADDTCSFTYRRLRPGVLLVRIEGDDRGQLGTAPLDEVKAELAPYPLTLFVDLSRVDGAAPAVSEEWTAWFAEHRAGLGRVHILTGSKVITLTVNIAKHLSRTGELIQITSEPKSFDEEIARLVPGFKGRDTNG